MNKGKKAMNLIYLLVEAEGQFSGIDLSKNSPNGKHKIVFTKSMGKHFHSNRMLTQYALLCTICA